MRSADVRVLGITALAPEAASGGWSALRVSKWRQASAFRRGRCAGIHRIRWDKPFREADTLQAFEKLLT